MNCLLAALRLEQHFYVCWPRPPRRHLDLADNRMGDQGVAALLPPPAIGKLRSLELLLLDGNQLSDVGLARVTNALDFGGLPALRELSISSNLESPQARAMAHEALHRRVRINSGLPAYESMFVG